ncbi:glycosyltransferase group 1 protein [Caballeronia hypogeia]|uniref:Glycosyltransferase group 1 protein n=1 Tax=Caballeronia hypogeia TaxID=1777140 RepID=A0A158A2B7_9BURK|nr:glycosyltransferase [Caballeronia hypogeia]SAK51962.1 glycosyltransferase group 1 protein [Caballeronia hypogeia]
MTHVHVHLFYGADPRSYRKGDDIGCLYGYHHAESSEFALSYSRDKAESRPMRLMRRALKTALGFDFIHTWRNRDALLSCDAVWTHTEQEYLSAALLLLLKGRTRNKPLLLAQSIWLLDKWPEYGALRRWAYRKLIARADILTTHSSVNAALVREYFGRDATQVFYGLNTRDFALREPRAWTPHAPLRVGAIGNDRDRDWTTLASAFRDDERYHVRIATRRCVSPSLRASNVEIAPAIGLNAARKLYDWADVIVVPLRANTHASGLTVLLESVALGKPVIVTDVGGLRDYFGTGHVSYVPAHDRAALKRAVDELRANPSLALARAQAALRHFIARDYTTREFALQHVRLTREALGRAQGVNQSASEPAVFASHELTQ